MVDRGTQVGSSLLFDVKESAEIMVQVAVARRAGLDITEHFTVQLDDRPQPVRDVTSLHGGRMHLIHAEPGLLSVTYTATIHQTGAAQDPAPVSALERIVALRPSRYCPSDRLTGFAGRQFSTVSAGQGTPDTVRAICAYVNRHTAYAAGASGPTTDAADTLLAGQGVCRDFAHLVAALARSLNIPARTTAVYAPGLSPMDFHAVVETEIDGVWRVWDATRLAPRRSLVRIATGADASETAFATVLRGLADLSSIEVTAFTWDADLPTDDADELITLG